MIRVFRHHVPIGTLLQVTADGLVLFGAVLLAMWIQLGPYGARLSDGVLPGVVFAGIELVINAAVGGYRRDEIVAFGVAVGRLLIAVTLGAASAYLVFGALPNGRAAQSVIGYVVLFAVAGLAFLRQLTYATRGLGLGTRRVLVVGTGPEARGVETALLGLGNPRLSLVGFYDADGGAQVRRSPARIFPSSQSLCEVVARNAVQEIIVAVRDQRGGVLPLRELLECRINGVPVLDLAGFYERVRGEVPIDSLKASWLIYGQGFVQNATRAFVKRVFDLVGAGILLALAAPVMLLTAVAIRLDSRGPILYRQERVGQGGRTFQCIKFRSMRVDAERDGVARWAHAADVRITRVGRLIRVLRIDELPQLINVIAGDMSLVGPRPERPAFVNQLRASIRFYDVRHSVKPGLSGWAQVRYGYGASVEDALRKLQFDLYYVKNHSLFLDLLILVETVRVVLFREGAR